MFTQFTPALLALAGAFIGALQPGNLKGSPDQIVIPEDNVFTTVGKLRNGQGNWIMQTDVIVDALDGKVWIKADAKVLSKANASLFGKTDKVIRVAADDKGVGVILPPGTWLWEPQDLKNNTAPMVPCMSWAKDGAAPPATSSKSGVKKGGL
jgi:hypothetical protein